MRRYALTAFILSVVALPAFAADKLPLMQGIYVQADNVCKHASNADTINYWGGDSGIGAAQAKCKIVKLKQDGQNYSLTQECTEVRSGSSLGENDFKIIIKDTKTLMLDNVSYTYCGKAMHDFSEAFK